MAVYVNFDEGVKRVMNNAKFYVKMLGKFVEDPSMNNLEAALSQGDFTQAYNAVHTLKGLAGNLSLTELFEQCVKLEALIKDKAVEDAQSAQLKEVYSLTLTEVKKVIAENG